jgi:hypothetical protein
MGYGPTASNVIGARDRALKKHQKYRLLSVLFACGANLPVQFLALVLDCAAWLDNGRAGLDGLPLWRPLAAAS